MSEINRKIHGTGATIHRKLHRTKSEDSAGRRGLQSRGSDFLLNVFVTTRKPWAARNIEIGTYTSSSFVRPENAAVVITVSLLRDKSLGKWEPREREEKTIREDAKRGDKGNQKAEKCVVGGCVFDEERRAKLENEKEKKKKKKERRKKKERKKERKTERRKKKPRRRSHEEDRTSTNINRRAVQPRKSGNAVNPILGQSSRSVVPSQKHPASVGSRLRTAQGRQNPKLGLTCAAVEHGFGTSSLERQQQQEQSGWRHLFVGRE
jgi:hypothetical protein